MNSTLRLIQYLSISTFLFASSAWSAGSAVVDVSLSPAGAFKGKTSDVKGSAVLKNGEVTAQNIVVGLKSLKTSVEVRDKHTLKYLEVDKYPEAVLVSAKGKDGKGVGRMRIRGVEKDVTGTYKIVGKELMAEFKLHLPDYKITGIKYMGIGVEDDVVLHVRVPVTTETAASPARANASAPTVAPARATASAPVAPARAAAPVKKGY